ncbi:hypothetical protein BN1263460222 [Stenotrophomonas indicatrix]|nr:hypothetical protein BN1263460222 [Stenotrophomonas indicatrix]
MTTGKTIATLDALRHLIVCGAQFGLNGAPTLALPEPLGVDGRGWRVERLLAVAVGGCYSSAHGIHHPLSFGGKCEQLCDRSPRIVGPGLPHGWRVPEHLEHLEILWRRDSSRLSRYVPSDGHGGRKALRRGRIKRHSQSTDRLQFCFQGINQQKKFVPGTSIWRIAILIHHVTNFAEVSLRPVQARPEREHRELVGRDLLRRPVLALTPCQVKGNQRRPQRGRGSKPSSDCRDCRPVEMATMPEGEARNYHVGQVHRPSSSLSCPDLATSGKARRRTA